MDDYGLKIAQKTVRILLLFVASKLNLIRPDGRCTEPVEVSPAKPGAKTPMSAQKSRQTGRAIRPVRSVWIVEIEEKRPAIFLQMPDLLLLQDKSPRAKSQPQACHPHLAATIVPRRGAGRGRGAPKSSV